MFGLSRSWFYLTLWRGTPPEFTSEYSAEIKDAEHGSAPVVTSSSADVNIKTMVAAVASMVCRELIGTDIQSTTEVVWYVG